jgi:hypothetical protein
LKVLSEIDFTDSLTDNSGENDKIESFSSIRHAQFSSDAVSVSSNNSNDIASELIEPSASPATLPSPGTNTAIPDFLDNLNNYLISTEINESGKRISVENWKTRVPF